MFYYNDIDNNDRLFLSFPDVMNQFLFKYLLPGTPFGVFDVCGHAFGVLINHIKLWHRQMDILTSMLWIRGVNSQLNFTNVTHLVSLKYIVH